MLNRELEGLPTSRGVRRRAERGEGLTTPELSVLLAWTKIVLAEKLIDSDLPDDPYCHVDLMAYFPTQLREGFEAAIANHPLRREIIVTQVVNDLVNGAGMTYWPRLAGETGATPEELTRANFVAREIFGSLPLREEIKTFDNDLEASTQTLMRIEMRTLVERASRWLVNNRRPPLDSQGTVDYFSEPVPQLMGELPSLLTGRELRAYEGRTKTLVDQQVPEDLASRVAVLHPAYMLLGVIEIADRMSLDPVAGRAAALRARRAARAARPGHPDPGAAARGPVADDGAGRAARRRVRRARPAHRARCCATPRPTTPCRRGSRSGRTATASWSSARPRPRRRSARTTPPTWPGCRWVCASCAGCSPTEPGGRGHAGIV